MKKSFLFISCEEAHHICDKAQYGEATPWEHFKLALRLSWCRISKAYTKRNNALSRAIHQSEINALTEEERYNLQLNFSKELKNQG